MFSVRLPRELLNRMRERKDINWAEVVREAIRRVLNEPFLPATLERLIRELHNSGQWKLLLCLYLKAELLDLRYLVKNLEVMYPGEGGEIVSGLDALLREWGIDPDLRGSYGGRSLRDLVKEGLLMYGVYDKFERDVREKLKHASLEVKKAAWLLSQYFIEDPYRGYEAGLYIVPHGFVRTLGLMLEKEDVMDIVDELVRMGLVFRDYYSSRAYSHEQLVGADYARPILIELSTDKSYLDRSGDLLRDENFLAFLKWLSKGYSLDFRAVVEYEEEEAKREFGDPELFDKTLKNLVKRGIVLIDYWPHRSRVGRRSSMPPHWVYKLAPIAKREILPFLIIEYLPKLHEANSGA
ncbi:MAG: hypothetical protein DRJ67_08690 [Thermoprotei archaeon]|nr:MAG: hypothetical protein DRJ67_08690 [Thermoprotei archaeon]